VLNRSHRITAYLNFRKGDEGVLLSQGGCDGGYSLYVQGGRLHYVHNFVAQKYFHAVSSEDIPEGEVELAYEFEATGKAEVTRGIGAPGKGTLFIGGKAVGHIELPVTTPLMFGLASWVNCGSNPGSPVTPNYKPPFTFSGKLSRVEVRISGNVITDRAAIERAAMAHQ
jgi:arylsulfatase